MMKDKKYRRIPRFFVLLLSLVAAVLITGIFTSENLYAQTSTTLKPGDIYDVGKAGKNTSVYINKAGTYTLKGESRYVRVVITCGDVKCYLDNVNLNNNAYSNTGRRSSPLNIVNDGGTVRLISKSKSSNYFEGYMNPGICKNGTKTKLIFETEKESAPGTIEAKGGVYSTGIGCVTHLSATPEWSEPTGNITINSGNVIGRGGSHSAGIGGSRMSSLNGLTINGGNVKAYGNLDGAGIGGGYMGRAENINITGGTVYAENAGGNSSCAAIGGGGGYDYEGASAYGKNITISGGNVTAVSKCDGAAIGGGANSVGRNITISGGTVDAKCEGFHTSSTPAIGGGGGRYPGSATGIRITGGYVKAKGGEDAPAIGSGGGSPGYTVDVDVRITGGVVIAEKGNEHSSSSVHNDKDIGAGYDHEDNVNVRITGGSVYADKIQNAKNDDDAKLHRVDVTCHDIPKDGSDYFLQDPVFSDGYSYGLKDVKLLNINSNSRTGMFYPWLPDTNGELSQAMLHTVYKSGKTEDILYAGDFKCKDKSGNLGTITKITLLPPGGFQDLESGSAYVFRNEDHMIIKNEPEIPQGRTHTGYKINQTGKEAADTQGKLSPDLTLMVMKDPSDPDQGWEEITLTDSSGKWVGNISEINLVATVDAVEYFVSYNSNKPANASTKITGKTDGQTVPVGEDVQINPNNYELPGYRFDSWNTKADGSGESYAPNDTATGGLSETGGGTVTLYAQWEPRKYDLKFSSGRAGTGAPFEMQDLEFDKEYTVPDVPAGWEDENNIFVCWKNTETGKVYYPGNQFHNAVAIYQDGTVDVLENGKLKTYDIRGVWSQRGVITVTVTTDGNPEQGHENDFLLISNSGGATVEYTPTFTYDSNRGVYTCIPSTDSDDQNYLPQGEYTLSYNTGEQGFEESNQTIVYEKGKTAAASFDYYTVSIERDPAIDDSEKKIWSANISPGGFSQAVTEMIAPRGTKLTIQTNFTEDCGYHFDGYTVAGIVPANESGTGTMDLSKARQAILVRGTATIMAHADANVYTVHFDPNTDKGISGSMEDQDMVWGTPQKLFANRFKCIGAVFTGWNTKTDGSGDSYNDRQSVNNLITKDGGSITLYALWNFPQYKITYDLDGGHLPGDALNPEKYTGADTFTLINPEREDHDFLGWVGTGYYTPSIEVTVPQGSAGNRVYIACWSIKHYNVTFETNGGSNVDQQSVKVHQKVNKPEDPVRDGYSFAGWYSDKGLTSKFNFGKEITQDMTLYAKWDRIKHTITYDLNGGTLDGKTGKIAVIANEGDVITIAGSPAREGYTFDYWKGSKYYPGDEYLVEKDHTFTAMWKKNPGPKPEPDGKVRGTLLAKMTAKGDNSLVLTWTRIKGTDGYDIFFIKCDKETPRKIKTVKAGKTLKWTKTGLIKGKPYKAYVKAFVMKKGKKTYVKKSPSIHVYTSGGTKHYTNVRSVTVKKEKVSLKAGKIYKIKANVIKLQKGKKLMPAGHAPKLRYISSNKKIARVSKTGKITAKGRGSCRIWVIAVNGVRKAVKVTVN